VEGEGEKGEDMLHLAEADYDRGSHTAAKTAELLPQKARLLARLLGGGTRGTGLSALPNRHFVSATPESAVSNRHRPGLVLPLMGYATYRDLLDLHLLVFTVPELPLGVCFL
jgi:hypothetical protein